jgi:hypothetical protein
MVITVYGACESDRLARRKIKPIPYNLITINARRPTVDIMCSIADPKPDPGVKLQNNMREKFKKIIFSSLFLLFAYNVFKVVKNRRYSEPQKFF